MYVCVCVSKTLSNAQLQASSSSVLSDEKKQEIAARKEAAKQKRLAKKRALELEFQSRRQSHTDEPPAKKHGKREVDES